MQSSLQRSWRHTPFQFTAVWSVLFLKTAILQFFCRQGRTIRCNQIRSHGGTIHAQVKKRRAAGRGSMKCGPSSANSQFIPKNTKRSFPNRESKSRRSSRLISEGRKRPGGVGGYPAFGRAVLPYAAPVIGPNAILAMLKGVRLLRKWKTGKTHTTSGRSSGSKSPGAGRPRCHDVVRTNRRFGTEISGIT